MKQILQTTRNRPNLDLLRSFAILFVVLDHTAVAMQMIPPQGARLGWLGVVGVYMFFVHTCLVLMWSLERKPHTLDFYIRRVFRIYPLAIVTVLIFFFTHLPAGTAPLDYLQPPRPGLLKLFTNLLLVQNFFGFHGVMPKEVVGVLWSLPLEVQMYVFLPVLFFFVREDFRLWPMMVIWCTTVLLVRSVVPVEAGNNFATVIPDFLPGVMAYILFRHRVPSLPAWTFPVFLGAIISAFLVRPDARTAWFFCLALGLALPSFRQISATWLVQASHEVAKYSYGIYLMHGIGIYFGMRVLRGHSVALQLSVELISTAALSIAAYQLIEKPFIDLGSRVANEAESRYERAELASV